MPNINYIVFDIDGTLTDGKIYISDKGELMKAFDIKDGYAIYHIQEHGIIPIIITGRSSPIVEKRCSELRIRLLYQGVSNKLSLLNKLVEEFRIDNPSLSLRNFAYMGDDIPDLECMVACGISGCPADAVQKIIDVSDFVSTKKAGNGAARDFIEWLLELNNN